MKYRRICAEFFNTPWAVTPEKLASMTAFILDAAHEIKAGDFKAIHGPASTSVGAVAVISVFGVITQRANMLTDISGGTSTEQLSAQIKHAIADDSIGAIVLNVDSPGGSVSGIQELSDEIFQARGSKRIVAIANSLSASAAYWIASAADEVVITPSGEVGSIGVLAAHEDHSEAMEKEGVKTKLISAGKYKVEGNPFEPLSEEAESFLQQRIDEYYTAFVGDVARNRGTTPSAVRSGYGEGRVLGAKAAVDAGLADRIATLDETIARLSTKRNQNARTRSARAELSIL